MQRKKVLFFLPTLGEGGAEKVLVNLVNSLSVELFDVTVVCYADVGGNKQSLSQNVRYMACKKKYLKGTAFLMKFFQPHFLHRMLIKEQYDVEVAYLEGISTRIISGCDNPQTKKVAWIHTGFPDKRFASRVYRSYKEFEECYHKFDKIVCVSKEVKNCFLQTCDVSETLVEQKYNIIDSDNINKKAKERITDVDFKSTEINLIGVGKIIENKGFDRLARVHKRLCENGYPVHTYILGKGHQQDEIEEYLINNQLKDSFTFLGYKENPYKYIKKCDMFICSSYREGFSTAATEALIVGTPVITTRVSGMEELLGDNQYGIICENDEESLYKAISGVINNNKIPELKHVAQNRGEQFSKNKLVMEIEKFLSALTV